jgi:hypothetical protein
MTHWIIKDAEGYWVSQCRNADKSRVHFWSSRKRDAARIEMPEVAAIIARHIPQPVQIIEVRR